MNDVRLIYCSHANATVTPDTFSQILAESRANNEQCGITGMLCIYDRTFIQCLEGSYTHVNRVYNRISADPRHTDCCLLSYENACERLFEGYDMGAFNDATAFRQALLSITNERLFLSLRLLGEASVELMRHLARNEAQPTPRVRSVVPGVIRIR